MNLNSFLGVIGFIRPKTKGLQTQISDLQLKLIFLNLSPSASWNTVNQIECYFFQLYIYTSRIMQKHRGEAEKPVKCLNINLLGKVQRSLGYLSLNRFSKQCRPRHP